ncbi:hypothetical protein GH714_013616 [Hevea brasiliensis]|uniref:BUB1 N-terminal domain-containing protein n=1 Tax=Hevea brasiliensis TaxID=3981 RepID=A0A6A6N3K8_HEVBR|nr:hypothetical protein GH714_013616 [Hevea brasiliensis]
MAIKSAPKVPAFRSTNDVKATLQYLKTIDNSKILALEVLWTPQDENDPLSEQEFLTNYPCLRGIKKMKETLPQNLLKEKLPRFLQKCTQTFESDRRYRNDLRYLRVWLQLMDYVDEPRALLRTMEMNAIGSKRSLFYQAYALYYEKMKKFEEAEKMYHLGCRTIFIIERLLNSLAEPVDELQKSYEQFLQRMERHKNKKIQEGRPGRKPLSSRKTEENNESACNIEEKPKKILDRSSQNVKLQNESNNAMILGNSCNVERGDSSVKKDNVQKITPRDIFEQQMTTGTESQGSRMFHGDDTVVVKFVDTAIVGKSEAEDACHHGLVDPTINMKEAMNAINSMFKEPLETAPISRRAQTFQLQQEPLQIFIDDEESDENGDRPDGNDNSEQSDGQIQAEGSCSSASHLNAFVFPFPKDLPSENSDDVDSENSPQIKPREDTVVHRFVGSTILDDPAVENVWHHGLVDPTINLKEAMDDINNMFGKPIDFVRTKRPKKQEKAPVTKQDLGVFQYFLMMIWNIKKISHHQDHLAEVILTCLSLLFYQRSKG